MTSTLAMSAALLSALAWALGAILFRKVGEEASPVAMNLAKSLMGLVFLGIAAVMEGSAWSTLGVGRVIASGILGIAVGDTLFFAALVRLEPRLTLLLATVGHVFSVVLAILLLKERPGTAAMVGIVLVLGGVAWVLQAGAEPGEGRERGKGVLYGLLSALATSSSLLLVKTGVEEMGSLQATWLRLAAGVVAVGAVRAVQGELGTDLRVLERPGLLRQLALAVAVVMFGGFWLSVWSLKYADASVVTALSSTEPLFVLVLSRVWLGEKASGRAVVAALIAVVGVGLIVGG